jgi:formylglycine-generating enzyme required for sulfatase activity
VAGAVTRENVASRELADTWGFAPAVVEPWHDGYPGPAPVGRFEPNRFGLCDMLGNAREWCRDAVTEPGSNVVLRPIRGSSWRWRVERCAARDLAAATYHHDDLTLRPAREVTP